MIDLHTHSTASDGSFSPTELVGEAAGKGLTALALTDHDTISGLDEGRAAAANFNIAFIPGIELQVNSGSFSITGEFHLLGLGIERPSADFIQALEELSQGRKTRNQKILEGMRELGMDVSFDDIKSLAGSDVVCRPHFAAYLINKRIVKNLDQAFDRYLGIGKPLYIPKAGLEFDRAAELIKESGGISVLAHPMSLYVAWGRLPALVANLKDRGLDGIEAWHPTTKPRACQRLEELGKSLGLFITAGSDFHGSPRPDRKLGYSAAGRKIDRAILDAIPALG